MTIQEAAKKIGCHTTTIYKAIRSGYLGCSRNTGGCPANKIDITQEALDEWMKTPACLVTKEQLAKINNVSVRTIDSWILKGRLKEVETIRKRKYYRVEVL